MISTEIPLEIDTERYLSEQTRVRGGDCLKFSSPSTAGVFDRLIMLPRGVAVFVEVKRFGESLSPLQTRFARRCSARAHRTAMVDSKEAVDALFAILDKLGQWSPYSTIPTWMPGVDKAFESEIVDQWARATGNGDFNSMGSLV